MEQQTIVSMSGTRHIIGIPPGLKAIPAHAFRITTLCGFGVRPEDALSEAVCDCEFCLVEATAIWRREAGWEEREKETQQEEVG